MDSNKTLKDWVIATRPWSFPASSMPVLVTLGYLFWAQVFGGSDVNWWKGLWALVNIIVFHAAGNTWSDYHDYKKGVDREDTIGGISITSGQFQAYQIKRLSLGLLALALISGIALLFCTGLPLLYVGLAGFILTIGYPWFKYRALGDADIFLTYSVLPILGTSFVATGVFNLQALWLSVPIGLITVAILHINNLRDIEHDKRANIKTFAMLMGGTKSMYLYCFEILFPFVWVVAGAVCGVFSWWSLIVLVALKPALDNVRKALKYKENGMESVKGLDEQTAKLQLMFSLMLFIGHMLPFIVAMVATAAIVVASKVEMLLN